MQQGHHRPGPPQRPVPPRPAAGPPLGNPLDDLLAAGLYRPIDPDGPAPPPEQAGEPAEPIAVELVRALAKVAALEDLVARQDDQLAFLRQLTVETVARRGAD